MEIKKRAIRRTLNVILVAFVSTICVIAITAGSMRYSHALGSNMRGIYVLPTGGTGLSDPAFAEWYITGYSIRVSWKNLEPQKGIYNWSSIDNIITLARNNGKFVTLRILAGYDSPQWLFDDPNIPKFQFISLDPNKQEIYGQLITLPVLWDASYLNEYYRFLNALSQRYSSEPLLYWVAVSGPVAGPATPHLPGDQSTVAAFVAAGYTDEKWLKVWKEAIDKTALAFPGKGISVCLDVPPFYAEMADKLADYSVLKYCKRACLQSNGLSAKVLPAAANNPIIQNFLNNFRRYANRATIGFQMSWASAWKDRGPDRLGPLDEAIDAGIQLKASYLEIYQDDISDPANASLLSDTANRLGANP